MSWADFWPMFLGAFLGAIVWSGIVALWRRWRVRRTFKQVKGRNLDLLASIWGVDRIEDENDHDLRSRTVEAVRRPR